MRLEDRGSLDRAIAEAGRIGRAITPGLAADLDRHVGYAFRTAHERVGVESGALMASGRSGSEVRDGGETWVGWIAYGDDSGPVDYAPFHLAVNEPWFAHVPATEAALEAVIDSHLRTHLG